jgi:hypothetical protein
LKPEVGPSRSGRAHTPEINLSMTVKLNKLQRFPLAMF